MQIVLAPHLDDEIIGCYSVLDQIDRIYYFCADHRQLLPHVLQNLDRYIFADPTSPDRLDLDISDEDVVYVPSRFDYHPLHRFVNRLGQNLPGRKMFYSVEMNTPWLEEESDPRGKRMLLQKLYPSEEETLSKSDKYFLFKSIKPFDSIIWASVRFHRPFFHCWPAAPERVDFLRSRHRHLLHIQADVQQFGNDRDLEYFILSEWVQNFFDEFAWSEHTSCEMVAMTLKLELEYQYPDRMVRVSVYEDGENGCLIE